MSASAVPVAPLGRALCLPKPLKRPLLGLPGPACISMTVPNVPLTAGSDVDASWVALMNRSRTRASGLRRCPDLNDAHLMSSAGARLQGLATTAATLSRNLRSRLS